MAVGERDTDCVCCLRSKARDSPHSRPPANGLRALQRARAFLRGDSGTPDARNPLHLDPSCARGQMGAGEVAVKSR